MADELEEMSWEDYQPAPDHGPPIDVLPGYMNSLVFWRKRMKLPLPLAGSVYGTSASCSQYPFVYHRRAWLSCTTSPLINFVLVNPQ